MGDSMEIGTRPAYPMCLDEQAGVLVCGSGAQYRND